MLEIDGQGVILLQISSHLLQEIDKDMTAGIAAELQYADKGEDDSAAEFII